ncbi:hypothetical protein QJS10_CPA08g01032 [Acorus calamus]|uniref:Reverse transcriptase zinc-binding domain-containing protein n=1 Tax=Acorus calamus TaxID=4465 RepID=A0AAV9E999_ACOCL|nr:hypothetical protein QJS10_CPA08g01032 [Acorus calamus]
MSFLAKGWFSLGDEFARGFRWRLGGGERIRFWLDHWKGDRPFWSKYPLLFHLAEHKEELAGTVWQGTADNGEWRLKVRRISNDLQVQELAALLEVLGETSITPGQPDQLEWIDSPSRGYTVKVGYVWWSKDKPGNQEMEEQTPVLWRWRLPCKIKIFVWLVLQNRLLTKVYRAKWRPNDLTECGLCLGEPETVEHLLLTCPVANRLWAGLSTTTSNHFRFQSLPDLWEAMRSIAPSGGRTLQARFLNILIPAGLWAIWRTRNDATFRGQRVYFENIWDLALGLIQDWGRHLAGLKGVSYVGGRLRCE